MLCSANTLPGLQRIALDHFSAGGPLYYYLLLHWTIPLDHFSAYLVWSAVHIWGLSFAGSRIKIPTIADASLDASHCSSYHYL